MIAALAVGAPALAHHAFQAEFDGNQPIMLQGKVTKVEWINPHTWVHMIVVTDGTPQEWMVEAGTPNTLLREGLTRDSLKPASKSSFAATGPRMLAAARPARPTDAMSPSWMATKYSWDRAARARRKMARIRTKNSESVND